MCWRCCYVGGNTLNNFTYEDKVNFSTKNILKSRGLDLELKEYNKLVHFTTQYILSLCNENSTLVIAKKHRVFFLCWSSYGGNLFWPPSMHYISVIITHYISQIACWASEGSFLIVSLAAHAFSRSTTSPKNYFVSLLKLRGVPLTNVEK